MPSSVDGLISPALSASAALPTSDIAEFVVSMTDTPDDPYSLVMVNPNGSLTNINGTVIGQMSDTGNYTIGNSTDPLVEGNAFQTPAFTQMQVDQPDTSFGETLAATQLSDAETDSYSAAVKPQVEQMTDSSGNSLTGTGVNVDVIDTDLTDGHSQTTENVINGSTYGIAPGAQVQQMVLGGNSEVDEGADTQQGLNSFISQMACQILDNASSTISNILSGSTKPQVVNMSISESNVDLYSTIYDDISDNPAWETAIYGSDQGANLTSAQQVNDIMQYVDSTVSNNTAFQTSLTQYQNTTAQAVQDGVTIVVAAGNEQNPLLAEGQNPYTNGEAFNYLGMSNNVITVAASTSTSTPLDLADDTVSSFSSAGNTQYSPTITTQGQLVAIDGTNLGTSGPIEDDGTSFATPLVSGTIALMLQKDPNLTFSQVESILEESAVATSAPSTAEGAGMLNVLQTLENTPSA
jgi:subtilisin family serine protease